jgi:hypothetical protein
MSKKIAVLSDFHCGHKVGLTPKGYLPEEPADERARWVHANQAYYNWYKKHINLHGPYDVIFLNGDLVDGTGKKSGGTEQITTDMEEQCDMAVKIIREIPKSKKCDIVITRGCVTAGHRVITSDLRWVPVEWLKVGDTLLACDENPHPESNRRYWKESVVLKNEPQEAEVFKIRFSDGTSIEATHDHPFLCNMRGYYGTKWGTVEFLEKQLKSSSVKVPLQKFLPTWAEDASYEAGYISAFFDGEGYFSQRRKPRRNKYIDESHCVVGAYQNENEVLSYSKQILEESGFDCKINYKDSKHKCKMLAIRGGLGQTLRFLGTFRPKRLLPKLDISKLGCIKACDSVFIESIERIGIKTIYALTTTSKTYVVEGFVSHNTPYHTGDSEDWENIIAERVDAAIGEHEWVDVEGVVFDLKHHPAGSSGIPHGRHSGVARDRLWNLIWAEKELQPKGDVFIRSHVHYHNFAGGPDWLAMTTPALQGFGSRFGARRCTGIVDFGFVTFTVNKGTYTWQPIIAKLEEQKAPMIKL